MVVGWILKEVTVFIGNQGSGKSSVAKLISTFMWMEKTLTRGDYDAKKEFINHNRFRRIYCAYHGLDNYFFDMEQNDIAEIEYQGNAYSMKYQHGKLTIDKKESNDYLLPQIMYVPAERNFISTIKSPKLLKLSSDSLVEFLSEFDKAKNDIKSALKLPINNADIEYDKLNDLINVKGQDYKVRLTEASSGFQSIVPLYLVSWFLANSIKKQTENTKEQVSTDELERFKKGVEIIWADTTLTDEQKRAVLSVLSSKFNKSAFINIVEEPEQNLFPTSQRHILNSLLEFRQMNKGNMLVMTTHSPYIINYLTLAVKAYSVLLKANTSSKKAALQAEISEIVPLVSTLNSDDLIIYELDDKGTIVKLGNYKGLPLDDNYLNDRLAETNDLIANLLEIEDRCL